MLGRTGRRDSAKGQYVRPLQGRADFWPTIRGFHRRLFVLICFADLSVVDGETSVMGG